MDPLVLLGFLLSLEKRSDLAKFYRFSILVNAGFSFEKLFPNIPPAQIESLAKDILFYSSKACRFVYPGHPDYPKLLLNIEDPPLVLSFIGHPIWKSKVGFAVVGSREPGQLSTQWCDTHLSKSLNELPLYLVSGGARGIDQIAHRSAIRAGLPTVAFIPAGLGQIYPQDFSDWIHSICNAGGAVVSEFAPNIVMQKSFFQRRNRLIAGVSVATLIVEARRRSGTLITARQTIEQGKPIYVLPSHPLDVGNQGGLDLLTEGATPVRDGQDLNMLLSAELYGLNTGLSDLVASDPKHH